ncbi:MAG: hypothetical protein ACYSWT_15880 [Planctomycetota bacterium]
MTVAAEGSSLSFELHNGLPQPKWAAFGSAIEKLEESEQAAAWSRAVQRWLTELASALSPDAVVFATEDLLFLANRERDALFKFAANVLIHLDRLLEGIGSSSRPWPHVVVVFAEDERFYDYIDYFVGEEGEYGGLAGMFVRRGYPHVVCAPGAQWANRSTIAHELTHDYLQFLDLPLWLEEGLTQTIQERLAGDSLARVDRELQREHIKHWCTHTLDPFWSGSGFYAAGDEQRLSYELALILLRSILLKDRKKAAQFVRRAHWSDAGEAAAQETLGSSLAEVASAFLGPGDWAPSHYDVSPEADAPNQSLQLPGRPSRGGA